MTRKIKVVLAKLGLGVHNRGIITVARKLRDAGMEIIYLGSASPDRIIVSAIQEDVDVVGVSSLSGAHLSLGSLLIQQAKKEKFKNEIVYVIGGVFPPKDIPKLQKVGFDGIFTSVDRLDYIVLSIQKLVTDKKGMSRRN